ncbi:alpha/beta fold hydrolase [Flindersiella endophytica]
MTLTATAADGTSVRAFDEGAGPVVLLLHGGMDDGSSWTWVARRLTSRYRVLRLHRRQYRQDLVTGGSGCTMAEEVAHVQALVDLIGEPSVVVGHSSGAVLALESLVASPGSFAGAVLYEPPSVTAALPLGGPALVRAQAALAAGRTGRALSIFLRDIAGAPGWAVWLTGMAIPLVPRLRRMAPHQIDDCAAIEALGDRLEAYGRIAVPTTLLGGDRSPAHLRERLDSLEQVLPNVERVVMRGQAHGANLRAPDQVADVVARLAARAFS